MPDDFDFLSDDPQPRPKTSRPSRPEPLQSEPPRAEAVDDEDEQDYADNRRNPIRADRRRPRDDRGDEPRYRGQSRPAKRSLSPLMLASIAGAALLVIGGGVTLVIVARGKDSEGKEKDKGGTTLAAGSPSRPAPAPATKKDPVDPNSPSSEVVEKVKKATVRILVAYKNGKGASGSGFVEKDSRLVLTNAHVVGLLDGKEGGPRAINLVVNSGEGDKEYKLGGELLDVDKDNDLAVIRPLILEIGERHIVPEGLVVPRSTNVALTQKLFVFGFPLGDALGAEISVRPTTVSSLRKDEAGHLHKIQVEGGMTFGNSGGPVVDVKGNVVGVAVSGIKGETINFAIPGEMVQQLLAKQRK